MEICTLHRVAEALPGEKVYLKCEDCLHIYRNRRQLRRDYRREVLWYLFRINHALGQARLARTLWDMTRVRADVVLFCPHCCGGL